MRPFEFLRRIIAPIVRYFSTGYVNDTREVLALDSSQEQIQAPWSAIFSKADWLHKVIEMGGKPALIGARLDACSSQEGRKVHMVLLTNFKRDEVPSASLSKLFFACLKSGYAHCQKGEDMSEIKIGNHVTVDVTQALLGRIWLEIKARRIKQLFVSESKCLLSQYCFFSDGQIGALQPQNFIRQDKHTFATQRDFTKGIIINIPHVEGALEVLVFANRGGY